MKNRKQIKRNVTALNYQRYKKSWIISLIIVVNIFVALPLINYAGSSNNVEDTMDKAQSTLSLDDINNKNIEIPSEVRPAVDDLLNNINPTYPSDIDIGKVLQDRDNKYNEIFEPWKSQAAIHALAFHEETGFLALAGGYLYDNEIHLFRLNVLTGKFDKVWDSGDGIIESDVMSIDFGDTDINDFLEIVAGSSDGHIYVFEQRHLYDPFTNTENMFDHVWTSPNLFRVFDVKVSDVDRDYRPDIVAGTWNGLHLYEYDEHSGYPFVEDHWITYREVFTANETTNKKIYSLETGDTNENGLPEIIFGTRDGTVYVYENGGISTIINGQPFPLIRDNFYELIWTSENYTWTPILDMDVGETDGTPGDELAIIAQGQGLLTLDWDPFLQTYVYSKVVRDYEPWETFGYWGLDYYVDRVIEANNVTYYDPLNASLITPEPIPYEWNEGLGIFLPDADAYPYNTGMAGPADGNYTTFDASPGNIDNATAIIDWGLDEEGTGGANDRADVIIKFKDSIPLDYALSFNFSVSQNGADFEQISPENMVIVGNELRVDVDSALSLRKWDWFRYGKISVFNGGNYQINSLELKQVYNLLTDGISVTIGPMRTDGENYLAGIPELDKIIVGTVMGKSVVVGFNSVETDYQVLWDSGTNERYIAGAGIWDMVYINSLTDIPIWHYMETPGTGDSWPTLDLSGSLEYNSWTYANLNPYAGLGGNYIIGTKNATLQMKTPQGDPDLTAQALVAPIDTYFSTRDDKELTAEVLFINNDMYSHYPMIAVSSFNPDANSLLNPFDYPRATLNFFYRPAADALDPLSQRANIAEIDITGEIQAQFAIAQYQPKTRFIDWDGDGDLDMIFTNGQLHYARNMQVESGEGLEGAFQLRLIPDYFAEINEALTSGGWGQPDVFDMDDDGDLDIILNYAHKDGTTFFKNTQTSSEPEWQEDKRVFWNWDYSTNIKLWNLTDSRILQTGQGNSWDIYKQMAGEDIDAEFVLVSYNRPGQYTWWAEPVYKCIDSYMVATYPEVMWTDFALMQSEDNSFLNFGFNVREAWSTVEDLEGWSMSIASGDIDGDGKGEIIVGDYDNNVYVFENMVNNTYKRMYQTPDISHDEVSTSSPYLYSELEGITGEFMRKIWDHAEHLLVDVDLDNDGLKEMIVAANLQIYVFEDKGLFGGDTLELIYSIDLRNNSFYDRPGWDQVSTISALTFGEDLDYNGQNELVVAAGPFLWVFNVGSDNFAGTEENDFFITDYSIEGRYALIGNPIYAYEYRFATIDALITGDTDKDGYKEIILGGTLDTRNIKDDGFTYIYECQGGTFYKAWEAPFTMTEWNPVSDIVIDDQDYDGKQEIIISHHYGFDIWEWIEGADSDYLKVEHITSSPNYPHTEVTKFYENLWSYNGRGYGDMANLKGIYDDYIVYIYSLGGRLMWQTYYEPSGLWTAPTQLTPSSYDFADMGSVSYETTPSVVALDDGSFYAVWKMASSTGNYKNYIMKYEVGVGWDTPVPVGAKSTSDLLLYPDVAELDSTQLIILFTLDYTGVTGSKYLYYTVTSKNLDGIYSGTTFMNYNGFLEMNVGSGSIKTLPNGKLVVAFSGINSRIYKSDYDIWSITFDQSLNFSKVSPHQVTSDFTNELWPNLAYMEAEADPLVVVYENVNSRYEERIGVSSSIDEGRNWGRNFELNSMFDDITRIEYPDFNFIEYVNGTSGTPYYNMQLFGTAIAGLTGGGFIYNFFWSYYNTASWWRYTINLGETSLHAYTTFQCYGINPEVNWAYNNLLDVKDIDVGDTDNDGRREVIAGWESQVSTYELKSSTDGAEHMLHEETWISDVFDNPFTALTVYDSNGNGWDEIGIATERGNVYLMEYPDPLKSDMNLLESQEIWEEDIGIYADPLNSLTYDYDSDGNDEIILIDQLSGKVMMVNETGEIVWSKLHGAGYTHALSLFDITNDTTPEILFSKDNGYIYVIDVKTGDQLWNRSNSGGSGSGNIEEIQVGDINNDGIVEVLYADNGHWLTILDNEGNFMNEYDLGSGTPYSSQLGYFESMTNLTFAYGDSSGAFRVINPLNGTIVYDSGPNIIMNQKADIIAYDVDEDGFDEAIIGDDRLRMVDVVEGSIFYNSTYYGEVGYNLILDNFDDDPEMEVAVQTFSNGIFLEDIASFQTKWHYYCDIGATMDIVVGNFGGTDHPDIAIVGADGYVVTVDGFTGNMLWFNSTGTVLQGIMGISLSGSNISQVVTWGNTGYLTTFEMLMPVAALPPEGFQERGIDYSIELKTPFPDLYVHDFNHDGIDEIVIIQDDTVLGIWDYLKQEFIYEKDFEKVILGVWFGELNGEGLDELILLTESEIITAINLDNSETLFTLNNPPNHLPAEIIIGNFNKDKDGNELAVLYEKYSITRNAVIEWYTNVGEFMYRSEYNTSGYAYNHMIALNHHSLETLDIAIAGSFGSIWIFGGNDGTRLVNQAYGSSVYGLYVGDFTGDGYDEIITENSIDTIQGWDFIGGGTFFSSMNFGTGNVLQIQIADLIENDTRADLVVNYRGRGIVAYKMGASGVNDYDWIYNAPLDLTSSNSKFQVKDHNHDGFADVSFMNYNYWNVIDGSTQRLIWHYQSETKLNGFSIGMFDEKAEMMGMVYYEEELVHIVSYYKTSAPLSASPLEDGSSGLAILTPQKILSFVGISCIVGVAFIAKKKKFLKK